ncbi:lysosomal proton-coupled steroid conjugate and bile acid symporter SLC46A3-like [Ylistrum balloti]|uniref:lysosomal proton-coupled steroid conjugate and bile acid symporter SLC46A3-like n=1 Tax=Ylistrum balloti TaxID=509963 RepID=UPI0029059EE2|nr:lysosomal proton-coupled steroid conjugate and bile acid symporter SLC46A3-like [Ylistrum balloti]
MLFLFSGLLSTLLTSQYIVHYFQIHMYPNSNLSTSEGSACNVNTSTEVYHERTTVQKTASRFNIYFKLADNLPALVTCGVIGGLSDRFGRTRVLTFTISLYFLCNCISSIIIYFEFSVYYLLIGNMLNGFGGGFYGVLSVGFAYISDVTRPGKQRTLMITCLEAAIGIGAALSGFVSGFVIQRVGFFYANICVCAATATSVLVIVLFLPHSRPRAMFIAKTSMFENARASFIFYFQASPIRYKYVLGIITFMTASLSLLGRPSTEILYQLNAPFCWTSVKVGYYTAISVSTSMILGVAIVKGLQIFFAEEIIAILSAISGMSAYTVEALAVDDVMLFMVPVIGFLNALVFPMVRSILSKLTPADRQGALFAGIAVVEIVANLGSNVGASSIYAATVGTMRGLVFLVFASMSLLTACLLLVYRITKGRSKTVPIEDVNKDVTSTQIMEEKL